MPWSKRSCQMRNASTSQRAAASRAPPRSPDIPKHERGHIVALHGTGGELAHAGEDALEQLGYALVAELRCALEEAFLVVLFPDKAQGLGHPVAEGHEDVARRHVHRLLLERGMLEEAE